MTRLPSRVGGPALGDHPQQVRPWGATEQPDAEDPSRGTPDLLGRKGRRVVVTAAAAVVLAIVATAAVAMAVPSQHHPPRPSPSAGRSTVATLAAPPAPPVVLTPSDPVALDIPAIGVHSKLQYLGLTQDGALEVPAPGPHYDEAAWYKYSPTPGSLGPAIISGHVDSAADGPSVFFRLDELLPGDRVMVTRADGLVTEFRVDGVHLYPKAEFPTQLVYGNTNHAALRLLTCGGPFDRTTGHYLDNVVVFASLVASHRATADGALGPSREG